VGLLVAGGGDNVGVPHPVLHKAHVRVLLEHVRDDGMLQYGVMSFFRRQFRPLPVAPHEPVQHRAVNKPPPLCSCQSAEYGG
jgi:hypothetical protein